MQIVKVEQFFLLLLLIFYSEIFAVGEVCSRTDDNKNCDKVFNKNTNYRL